MVSEDRLRHCAVHDVICYDEEGGCNASRSLVFDKIWDHAGWVHFDDMLDVDATVVRLPAHIGESVVCDNIAVDRCLVGSDQSFIASA